MYSYPELVDFVFPEKGTLLNNKLHFCYRLNILRAFVNLVKDIENLDAPSATLTAYLEKVYCSTRNSRAIDHPFDDCKKFLPPLVLSHPNLGYIGAAKSILTIEEALIHL